MLKLHKQGLHLQIGRHLFEIYHRKLPNKKAIHRTSHKKSRDDCNNTSLLIAQFTHNQNEVSQKISSNTHDKQVVEEDLVTSVKQCILDLNSSVGVEDTAVEILVVKKQYHCIYGLIEIFLKIINRYTAKWP